MNWRVWHKNVGKLHLSTTDKNSKPHLLFILIPGSSYHQRKVACYSVFSVSVTILVPEGKYEDKSTLVILCVVHWPQPCRCWRGGLSCHIVEWWFYSSCRARPCALPPLMKYTHSPSSHGSCCCHSTWTGKRKESKRGLVSRSQALLEKHKTLLLFLITKPGFFFFFKRFNSFGSNRFLKSVLCKLWQFMQLKGVVFLPLGGLKLLALTISLSFLYFEQTPMYNTELWAISSTDFGIIWN